MEFLRFVGLAVFFLAAPDQSALASKSVALVIGNSAYEHVHGLTNPEADSSAVAESFRSAGFEVVELRKNLTASNMRRALRDFADTVKDADVAVVYFAGHGLEIDGTNYLVPVDAVLARDIDAFDEAIPLDRLLTVIEPAKQLRLVILDSCRDNPFASAMKRTIGSRTVSRGLAKVEPNSPNTLIAYAAKAGSTASDGDGPNSPFTRALVKYVTKPGLDIRKAFGFVRDEVLKDTRNRQEPFVYGSLGGEDVSLVPARNLSLPLGSDQANDVRRDYELALQVSTTASWNSFLSLHPTGFYADLAREQLQKTSGSLLTQSSKAAEEKLASLSPAERPVMSSADLNHAVQVELRRVGCLTEPIGEEWTPSVHRSLDLFNKYSGMRLNTKLASLDALEAIKAKPSRTCPLDCVHGYKPDDGICVKISCDAGFFVNDNNECEIQRTSPSAKLQEQLVNRKKPKRQEVPSNTAKSQDSRRVICNQQGCRPLQQGCHVETGTMSGMKSSTYQTEVCDQKAKREQVSAPPPTSQASGQVICSQTGCRPVRQGCHLDRPKKTWVTGDVEICN